jgi:hypothetical protein
MRCDGRCSPAPDDALRPSNSPVRWPLEHLVCRGGVSGSRRPALTSRACRRQLVPMNLWVMRRPGTVSSASPQPTRSSIRAGRPTQGIRTHCVASHGSECVQRSAVTIHVTRPDRAPVAISRHARLQQRTRTAPSHLIAEVRCGGRRQSPTTVTHAVIPVPVRHGQCRRGARGCCGRDPHQLRDGRTAAWLAGSIREDQSHHHSAAPGLALEPAADLRQQMPLGLWPGHSSLLP